MTKLREDERCEKCGQANPDMLYRFPTTRVWATGDHEVTINPASLRLTCRRCGYVWERAPLDAPAEVTNG